MSDYHFPDPLDVEALGRLAQIYIPFVTVALDGDSRDDVVAASVSGGWVEVHEFVRGQDHYDRKRISGVVELGLHPSTPKDFADIVRMPLDHPDRVAFEKAWS